LVNTTATVGSVSTEKVKVNYVTKTSACVATLTNSVTCKRVMKSEKVCVRTLTNTRVSIQKVKNVIESLSQSIQRSKKCQPSHNGQGFGALNGSSKNTFECACSQA